MKERLNELLVKVRLNVLNCKKYYNMFFKRSEKFYIRYDIWIN